MPWRTAVAGDLWYHPLAVNSVSGLANGLALIFDLDGVIVDSNPVHEEVWRLYLRRFGIELDEEMISRMYGRRNDEIVRDFFGPLGPEEVFEHGAAKEALFREVMRGQFPARLVAGVGPFLERHRTAPIGMATNAEPLNAEFALGASGLREYFRVVVDGHQVDRPKPDPEIYLTAARMLGTAPGDCIVFEDSLSGVNAARAAGTRVVGVTTTHCAFADADLNIENFLSAELEAWLSRQSANGRS